MSYPARRRVVVTVADLRSCTVLERARAAAVAGVPSSELAPMLRAISAGAAADPAAVESGITLFYALTYQLERRLDPSVTWADAQTWDAVLDAESVPDPIAEAEAEASVTMAIATGLPPSAAGELTMAQVDVYAHHAEARAAAVRRRRGRRT